jgi:hypothetical protein
MTTSAPQWPGQNGSRTEQAQSGERPALRAVPTPYRMRRRMAGRVGSSRCLGRPRHHSAGRGRRRSGGRRAGAAASLSSGTRRIATCGRHGGAPEPICRRRRR